MSRHAPLGAVVLLAALTAACPPEGPSNTLVTDGSRDTTMSATDGSRDTAAARTALDGLWAQYSAAAVAGDVAGVTGLYGEDARLDVPGMPTVIGQEALRSAVTAELGSRTFSGLVVTPVTTLAPDSLTIHQIGSYAESYQEKGKRAQTDYGRYLSSVVRQADGQWRIAYLMAFVDSTRPAGKR